LKFLFYCTVHETVSNLHPFSDITELLPLYIKHRLPGNVILHRETSQLGLIGARLAGARVASGSAIIILDSHCEATYGWIQPLLQRIKDKPTNIGIPQIDGISDRNLEFNGHPGGIGLSVGGFTWSGHFTWIPFKHDNSRKASDVAPTATMAGGLFAMDREFFFKIGGYDEGMTVRKFKIPFGTDSQIQGY
jgi:polypeptide N-acetylgalactosaminyltransferase